MQIQESLKTARDKYGELADKYKHLDPTPSFKYIEWICKQIRERLADGGLGWNEHNARGLNQYLIEWDKYLDGGRIPQDKRDINKNTLRDVITIVDELRATPSKTQVKRKRRDPALEIQWKTERDDAETVYENKDWIVVIPYSQAAAMELGELSTWCIAYDDSNSTNRNKFWEYVKPGPIESQFYFILGKYADLTTKKPAMYAIRITPTGKLEAFDRDDNKSRVEKTEDGFIMLFSESYTPPSQESVIPIPYDILKPFTSEQLNNYVKFYDENDFEHNFVCEDCEGEGYIECSTCDGSGTVLCDECGGDGKMDCDVCDGKGTRPCWACDESGTMKCEDCDGLGKVPCSCDGEEECDVCDADGMESCEICEGGGTVDCSVCGGDGTIDCEDCDGTGEVECEECDGTGGVPCPDCDEGIQTCPTCDGEGRRITNFHFCSRCNDKGVDYSQQPCPTCAPYRKHEIPEQTEAKEIERLHALIQKNWGNYLTHPLKETTQKHHYVSTLKTPTGELLSLHAGYKHNVGQSYLQLRNMNKTVVAEGEIMVRNYLKRVYNM